MVQKSVSENDCSTTSNISNEADKSKLHRRLVNNTVVFQCALENAQKLSFLSLVWTSFSCS